MERPFLSSSSLWLAMRLMGACLLGQIFWASEISAAQFTLTWTDNSTNESGFRIERSSNGTTFTEVATVGANVVSYVDAGLPNSTTYWYRLRAYNAAGNSGYSNIATGTTPPVLSNNAPTISNIGNRSIYVGGTTGTIPFTVGDVETSASGLTVTVASNNTTLAPLSGLVLSGSGSNRTITVTPAAGRTGTATVTVTVSDGTLTTSDTFVLAVLALGVGPTIASHPQATSITPGSALTLNVTAVAVGAVSYQWYCNETAIEGATSASYTIPIAQRTNAGAYYVVVTSGGVSVSSYVATVGPGTGTASSVGRLVNLSSRASVLTGDNLLIPGFVISGSGNKRLLLRVVGPSLASFGLSSLLSDPKLVLKQQVSGAFVDVATNLDWADSGAAATLRQAFTDVGAFGLTDGSGDAALLVNLAPGVYSVFATDEITDRTGLSIVEVYDADAASTGSSLANISTRGFLGTGSNVMITGFVIEDGPMTLLLRTIGPGLTERNVPGAVADPNLELHGTLGGVDIVLASNDDWGVSNDSAYTEQIRQQVSAFPLTAGSKDAACVVTLPAGRYTVISRGAGTSTGLGLVELFVVR